MMYLRSKLAVTTHYRVVPIVPHYIRTSFLHSLYSLLTLAGMKGVVCFIVHDASRGTVRQIVPRWMTPSSSVSWSFTTPWSESFTWNDSFRNDPFLESHRSRSCDQARCFRTTIDHFAKNWTESAVCQSALWWSRIHLSAMNCAFTQWTRCLRNSKTKNVLETSNPVAAKASDHRLYIDITASEHVDKIQVFCFATYKIQTYISFSDQQTFQKM
jgi:hypothetical protein